MRSPKKQVNVPDILIGVFLMAGIPLVTYGLLPGFRQDQPGTAAQGPKPLPLTAGELEDFKAQYIRMYSNARLFLLRASGAKNQAEEQAWARQVLDRCRKGFADLQARAKASADLQGALPEIERYLRDIDLDLRTLPYAPPPAGSAPR